MIALAVLGPPAGPGQIETNGGMMMIHPIRHGKKRDCGSDVDLRIKIPSFSFTL